MFCTGQTMTFIPLVSVIARTAFLPGTQAGGDAAAADTDPSVRYSEAMGVLMPQSV